MSDPVLRALKYRALLLSGHGRRETIGDIEYAVYPAVMLVEGVHHGLGTPPVYYPSDVLERSAPQWHGVPVTIQHPTNADGELILCDNNAVLEEWAIGHVRNTAWIDNKLKGEVWIDIVVANLRQPGLVGELDSGAIMELSTGMLASDDGIANRWQTENYNSSIVNIFPDHLALLPGGEGACSIDDGCGIRANKKEGSMPKDNASALFPQLNGESGAEEKAKQKRALQGVIHNELSHEGIDRQLWDYVDSLDTFDGDGNFITIHFVQAVYDDYFVYSKRTEDGVTELFRQDYIVDAEDKVVLGEEIQAVREDVKFVPIANTNNEEVTTMADGKPCCPEKVSAIIANENSAFTEDDREMLLEMEKEVIEKILNTAEAVVQESPPAADEIDTTAAAGAAVSDADALTAHLEAAPPAIRSLLNAGLKQLDNTRAGLIATIMANERNTFNEEQLKNMEVDQLEAIATLATIPAVAAPTHMGQHVAPTVHANANEDHVEDAYVPRTLGSNTTGGKK